MVNHFQGLRARRRTLTEHAARALCALVSALSTSCAEERTVDVAEAPEAVSVVATSAPAASATASATSATASATSATASATSATTSARNASPTEWLERLLGESPLAPWLERADELRIQVLVREVKPLPPGTRPHPERVPELVVHRFRVDAEYVYPASALKTFLSVAALRELRALAGPELLTLPEHPLRETIERLQIASDNQAFAELYDFVGHRELNTLFWELGFRSLRVHHRMGETREAGLSLPPIAIAVGGRRVEKPARTSALILPPTPASKLDVGSRHKTPTGALRAEPMPFTDKNYVSLEDLQRLNLSLVHPGADGSVALGLVASERTLLLDAMSATGQGGAQHRPMLTGVRKVTGGVPVRYVGKAGRAYGFHLANAYLENEANGRAMYVTAAIYANPNGVVNDDRYDYEGTSEPFMETLGAVLATHLLR